MCQNNALDCNGVFGTLEEGIIVTINPKMLTYLQGIVTSILLFVYILLGPIYNDVVMDSGIIPGGGDYKRISLLN